MPSLRRLRPRWHSVDGRDYLFLEDPLRLSDQNMGLPVVLAPMLGLMDGTRDAGTLAEEFGSITGIPVAAEDVRAIIEALDERRLLENQQSLDARETALSRYRSAPFRAPALAGSVYPEDPEELRNTIDEFCDNADLPELETTEPVMGVISPHIDFHRGWRTYAKTWRQVRKAAAEASLIILLGTDHSGTPNRLTLTRQSYATPWGVLPTDTRLVDRLAEAVGLESAFDEELHHVHEHSIELAAVWLHYVLDGKPKPVAPILCGHHGDGPEGEDWGAAGLRDPLRILAETAAEPGVLVVAAGDVSHVGPAFGDRHGFTDEDKALVRSSDARWLETACLGDSGALWEHILSEGDGTRICGAAPIHHMLAALPGARGRLIDYDQCPADQEFGSLVSIAGALFTR